MPEQDPGPMRVRDLSVEAHGSTVLILHGDGDETERRVFQGIPVAPGDGLVLASSNAARASAFHSALRHACRMALTAAAKRRPDESTEPRLWLAVSGLGRGDGRGKAPAQKIAREFSAEVFAPDGPLTFVAGGSIFAGADHHRWMRFAEGGPGEFHGARYPQPDWEARLPRGEVADGGLQTRPVPAGLAVSADDVLSHSVAVSAWHPRLVLGSPGGDPIAPHQVAALLRRFPKPLLDRIQLVPADPRTASSQWLRKLAQLVEHDIVSATGMVRHDTRTEFVYIADEAGNPLWQPFPSMLRYSPTGTATPVVAGPPPRGWTPGPLVYRWGGAPSPRPVPQEIVAKVVPSGLTLLPAAQLGLPGAADRLTFESSRFTVALGWPCAPVPEGTHVALYRLLAGLAPEQLARLRLLVLGVADERMRSEILSAAGEWAHRVSFPSVLAAPLAAPQHARARGYGSEYAQAAESAGTERSDGEAVPVTGGAGAGDSGNAGTSDDSAAVRDVNGSSGAANSGGIRTASAAAPPAESTGSGDGSAGTGSEVDGATTPPEAAGSDQARTSGTTGGSRTESTADASTAQAAGGSAAPDPSTAPASDPVATVRLSRSLIQAAAESPATAPETAAAAPVPAMSSATKFTKVQSGAVATGTGTAAGTGSNTITAGTHGQDGSANRGTPDCPATSNETVPNGEAGKAAAVHGAQRDDGTEPGHTGVLAPGTAAQASDTNGTAGFAATPARAESAGPSAPVQGVRPRAALPKRIPAASPLARQSAMRRAAAAARLAAAQDGTTTESGTNPGLGVKADAVQAESAQHNDSPRAVAAPGTATAEQTSEQPEPAAARRKSTAAEASGTAAAAPAAGDSAPAPATAHESATDASSDARDPSAGSPAVPQERTGADGDADEGNGVAGATAPKAPAATPDRKATEPSTSDTSGPDHPRDPRIGGSEDAAAHPDHSPDAEVTARIRIAPPKPATPTVPPVPPVAPVTSSSGPPGDESPPPKPTPRSGPDPHQSPPPAPAAQPDAAPPPDSGVPANPGEPTATSPNAGSNQESPGPADPAAAPDPVTSAGSAEPSVAQHSPADAAAPRPAAEPALVAAGARPEFRPDHQSTAEQRTAFSQLLGDAFEAALPSVNTALATFPALREEQLAAAKSDFVAVHVYLGDDDFGATAVNAALRNGPAEQLNGYLACLLSGMRRLPVHRGPVFRLLDAEALDSYESGMLLTEPAFVSASSAPGIAAARGSDLSTEVIIWSQSARRTSAFHRLGLVDEVIFPAGSRFRVLAVDPPGAEEPPVLLLRELRADEEPEPGELTDTDQALLPRLRRALERRRRGDPHEVSGDALHRITSPVGLLPNG